MNADHPGGIEGGAGDGGLQALRINTLPRDNGAARRRDYNE